MLGFGNFCSGTLREGGGVVKVDPNAPASELPIRLEIASRISAGIHANPVVVEALCRDTTGRRTAAIYAEAALEAADALIAAHNATQKEEK